MEILIGGLRAGLHGNKLSLLGSFLSVCLLTTHPRSGKMVTVKFEFGPEEKVIKQVWLESGV